MKVIFEDVQTTAGQDLAVVHAVGTYAAFSADGAGLPLHAESLYLGAQAGRSAWKIIHEHTSTPISSSDTQAIFHRVEAA